MSRQEIQPPRWALNLLRWYCKPKALEIIEGDIHELFEKRLRSGNLRLARRMFVWDVFRFFRLKYTKGIIGLNSINNIAMFKNYFKISLRSLYRQRTYSLINISGLSVALAACLLIVLYVSNELSYDKFHKDADRIYRFASGQSNIGTPARLGIESKLDFPEIEETARLSWSYISTFKVGDKVFREPFGFSADSTLHKVFSIDFLEGYPDKALTEPNAILLTESLAQKFFDDNPAYDELIQIDGITHKVTGIIADPPKNTHFYYRYIRSFPHNSWMTVNRWYTTAFATYGKLIQGVDVKLLSQKFPEFMRRHGGQDMLDYYKYSNYDELLANIESVPTFSLKPITDLHLYHPEFTLSGSSGDITHVYIFSVSGFLILLIACINFINLSTARSTARLKEVGMRKVLGSHRKQLISQFLIESMLITIFATILSLALVAIFLESFNGLVNRQFSLASLFTFFPLIQLFGFALIIGLLAGCYPAFYLSGFKPIKALKGESKTGFGNIFLRKGLVAFQFAVSIFLIISTAIVFTQLRYMSTKKLGLNAKQVLTLNNVRSLEGKIESFRNLVLNNPNVERMSFSDHYLTQGQELTNWTYHIGGENSGNSYKFKNLFVSSSFFSTLDISLKEGHAFSDRLVSDTASVIINEAAAKLLGKGSVLGRKISDGDRTFTVIGVVKNFHYGSLKHGIFPMVIRYIDPSGQVEPGWWGARYMNVKVTGEYKDVVKRIEAAWEKLVADEPFDYFFLDDSFSRLYDEDRRFGKLFRASAVIALVIACLGLFALVTFTLERRNKEIAIRKVLGARIYNLALLIVSDFTKLALIGSIVAIPLGYLVMNGWLDGFAYRTKIGFLTLLIPPFLVIVIAWLTVGNQCAKAALSNPVRSLRSE